MAINRNFLMLLFLNPKRININSNPIPKTAVGKNKFLFKTGKFSEETPKAFDIPTTQIVPKIPNDIKIESKTFLLIFSCFVNESSPIAASTDSPKVIKNISLVGCEDETRGILNSNGSFERGFSVANSKAIPITLAKNSFVRLRPETKENTTKIMVIIPT